MDYSFKNPTSGRLEGEDFLEELLDYLRRAPDKSYLLTVGTDSCQLNDCSSFVSVVAIQRVGHGGRYFWDRFYERKFEALRPRIYTEAQRSLKLATRLTSDLGDKLELMDDKFDIDWEIHVDIGSNGPTRTMINEIVGMIRGNGYTVRTKPEAYCAAVVADRHV
ncbi:MAG: ribonuclease H-like YkuK family protein [bacterium]